MLGEDHSLIVDFPELAEKIKTKCSNDEGFAAENKRYNALDSEIRKLELQNSPIDDEEMHRLKEERAALKDDLYQKLTG